MTRQRPLGRTVRRSINGHHRKSNRYRTVASVALRGGRTESMGLYMDAGVPKSYKFTTITFTLVDSRSSLNLILKFKGNTFSDAATGSAIGLSLVPRVIEEINPCTETVFPQNAVTDGQPEVME